MLFRSAGQCLKRIDLDRRIRLLGVRAAALAAIGANPDPATGTVDGGTTAAVGDTRAAPAAVAGAD